MPAREHLLHREEGIDLRLSQPQRHASGVVREMPPTPVSDANRNTVGSISMKSGLNVGVLLLALPASGLLERVCS
jgi:hypothetical protein